MESNIGEGFRNIPIRCYTPETPLLQRLIRPMDDTTGTWTTLQDALLEFFPHISLSQSKIHGFRMHFCCFSSFL